MTSVVAGAAAGARVTLRPPTAADEAPFLALVQASVALHHPWVAPPETPAAFHAYLDRASREHDEFPAHVCRLVCRAGDGVVVGVANLNHVVWGGVCSAALGYYTFAPHAGRGYVREGVAALLSHGFRRTHLHRVEAAVQPDNARSLALLAALGFRHEGDSPRYMYLAGAWRDHQRWAITAEEWAVEALVPNVTRVAAPRAPRRRPRSAPRDPERSPAE